MDEVISTLEGFDGLSAEEQADVIENAHDRLRQTLDALDQPAPPPDAVSETASLTANQDSTD